MLRLFLAAALASAAAPAPDARRLLDGAAETGAANPEFGVMVLLHSGLAYESFDKARAVELLQQAFAAASALGNDNAPALQGEVVKALAEVSLPAAIEKLAALPDAVHNFGDNVSPVYRIVARLLASSEFDRAIEAVGLVPASAEYPFTAADRILEKLPKDDPRRVMLFGRALEAYKRRPEGPFAAMLERHWKDIPRQLADSAASALGARVLEWKDDSTSFSGDAVSEDKPPEVHTPRQVELCNAMRAIRAADPERAKRILGQRPDIRSVVDGMSKRTLGDNAEDGQPTGDDANWAAEIGLPFVIALPGDAAAMSKRIGQWANIMAKSDDFQKALKESPSDALRTAEGLPLPTYRAEAFARIARELAARNPAEAQAALARCTAILAEEKEAALRISPLLALAGAADALKDPKTAWNAMVEALDAAAVLYRRDTDSDLPNTALREYWPSTQAVRMAIWNAGHLWKAEAEPLLAGIAVPDLALIGKVELARALLGKSVSTTSIKVSHTDK
jgi:hypothetical protein